MKYLEYFGNLLINQDQTSILVDKENKEQLIYFDHNTARYKRDDFFDSYTKQRINSLIYTELIIKDSPDTNFIIDKEEDSNSPENIDVVISTSIKDLLEIEDTIFPKEIYDKQESDQNLCSKLRREILAYIKIEAPRYTEEDFLPQVGQLPVENGIIDFKSGELIPYSVKTKILDNCPCIYDPEITDAPKILLDFISESLFDKELSPSENLRKIDSYFDLEGACLTGDPSNKFIIVNSGVTNSGKTVIQNTFKELLGPVYSGTIDSKALSKTNRSKSDIRPEIIKNRKVRELYASEGSDECVLDSVFIKTLSGKDTLSYRSPHKETITFKFNGIIRLATNFIPKLDRLDDEALLKRIIIIDFLNTVPDDKLDPDLPQKLLAQKNEIFSFFCSRAIKFYDETDEPIKIHSSFIKSKEQFLLNQCDPTAMFIKDRMTFDKELELSILKQKWSGSWIYQKGFLPYLKKIGYKGKVSNTAFGKKLGEILESYPSVQKHTGGRCNYYTGIQIKDCPHDDTFKKRIINEETENAVKKHLRDLLQHPIAKVSMVITMGFTIKKLIESRTKKS